MWFLTGLPERRIGLFVRMHHAMADGIAGVAIVGTFLGPTPDTRAASPRFWTPAALPRQGSSSATTCGDTPPGWQAHSRRWYIRCARRGGYGPPGQRCVNSSERDPRRRPAWTA